MNKVVTEDKKIKTQIIPAIHNTVSLQAYLKTENGEPIANQEVGVDIEEDIEKNMDILLKIFNEAESKMIKEHADFYYLWCAKESLIKCMGTSIAKIKEIPSLPLNGLKTFKGIDYQSQTFIYDKHIISLTKVGKDPFVIKTEVVKKLPIDIK